MDDLSWTPDWDKLNSRTQKLDKKKHLIKKHGYNVKKQYQDGYRFKKEVKDKLWKTNLEKQTR